MRQNRPEPGDLIGERYRLLSPLGSGGMAEVFRAHDERLDRDVAVKVFRADLADAVDPQRTTRETHLLAGMSHPTVVAVLDASDDTTALPYLVMELVEGRDLGGMLADGALPPDFARRIVADVADALRLLHSRSVVHRDVKPANILVLGDAETDRTGVTAKLTDFGIARMVDGTRLTTSDSILGTAAYLSPEQVRGGGVGPASDVYSLALVLIECLSGGRAFPGPATEAAVARLTRPPALPQNASPKLAALLSRMTARDPAARPPAGEIVEALRGELVGAMTAPESLSTAPVPVLPMAAAAAAVLAEPAVAGGAAAAPAPEGPAAVAVPPVAPEVEDRPRRRHPLLPAGLGVLCLAVLAGLGVFVSASALRPPSHLAPLATQVSGGSTVGTAAGASARATASSGSATATSGGSGGGTAARTTAPSASPSATATRSPAPTATPTATATTAPRTLAKAPASARPTASATAAPSKTLPAKKPTTVSATARPTSSAHR